MLSQLPSREMRGKRGVAATKRRSGPYSAESPVAREGGGPGLCLKPNHASSYGWGWAQGISVAVREVQPRSGAP